MLKACLDLGRAENVDVFILHAMGIYETNLAYLDGRGRDAPSTLRAASGGFATIRGRGILISTAILTWLYAPTTWTLVTKLLES